MTELLFDTPWWLPALIAGVGIVLFWTGNNRRENKVRNTGLAVIAAGGALVLLSYFVDTPREKVLKNTVSLVKHVEARQWSGMSSLLDPKCTFEQYNNRDEIVTAAQTAVERFGVATIRITSLVADPRDKLITANMDVISEQDITMGRPFPTSWQLDWHKTSSGWLLRNIRVLESSRQAGSQAAVKENLPSIK